MSFFLGIMLVKSPEIKFSVVGGVIITLINSRKIKWWFVLQEVRIVCLLLPVVAPPHCWVRIVTSSNIYMTLTQGALESFAMLQPKTHTSRVARPISRTCSGAPWGGIAPDREDNWSPSSQSCSNDWEVLRWGWCRWGRRNFPLFYAFFFLRFFVFILLEDKGKRLQFTAKMGSFTPTLSAPTPCKTSWDESTLSSALRKMTKSRILFWWNLLRSFCGEIAGRKSTEIFAKISLHVSPVSCKILPLRSRRVWAVKKQYMVHLRGHLFFSGSEASMMLHWKSLNHVHVQKRGFTKLSVSLKRVSLLNPQVRANCVAFPVERTRQEPRSSVRFWAAVGV